MTYITSKSLNECDSSNELFNIKQADFPVIKTVSELLLHTLISLGNCFQLNLFRFVGKLNLEGKQFN